MARTLGWPTLWSKPLPAKRPPERRTPPPPPPLPDVARGVPEAFDTLAAAGLLAGRLSPVKARELIERLAPYRARLLLRTADPLDGLAPEDGRRIAEATMRYVAPVLVDALLPAARDHVLDRLIRNVKPPPGAGPLPSVREVTEAMSGIVTALNGAGRATLAAIAVACEREARTIADRLISGNAPAGKDMVDQLASSLLRVEVLTLTLDGLGRTSALEPTRFQSLRLARHALRRATEVLEAFATGRDLAAFRDSLSVLAAVDALIVIVLRILDAQTERREEWTPFVEPADQTAMGRYLAAAGRLAEVSLDLAGRAAVSPSIDPIVFTALIRQIVWLHRFCAHCSHAARPLGLDQLQERLAQRTARLAVFAGEALLTEIRRPEIDPARLAVFAERAQAIAGLLERMERPEEREALTQRVELVRRALEIARPAG